jgi:hypothetical protein
MGTIPQPKALKCGLAVARFFATKRHKTTFPALTAGGHVANRIILAACVIRQDIEAAECQIFRRPKSTKVFTQRFSGAHDVGRTPCAAIGAGVRKSGRLIRSSCRSRPTVPGHDRCRASPCLWLNLRRCAGWRCHRGVASVTRHQGIRQNEPLRGGYAHQACAGCQSICWRPENRDCGRKHRAVHMRGPIGKLPGQAHARRCFCQPDDLASLAASIGLRQSAQPGLPAGD